MNALLFPTLPEVLALQDVATRNSWTDQVDRCGQDRLGNPKPTYPATSWNAKKGGHTVARPFHTYVTSVTQETMKNGNCQPTWQPTWQLWAALGRRALVSLERRCAWPSSRTAPCLRRAESLAATPWHSLTQGNCHAT